MTNERLSKGSELKAKIDALSTKIQLLTGTPDGKESDYKIDVLICSNGVVNSKNGAYQSRFSERFNITVVDKIEDNPTERNIKATLGRVFYKAIIDELRSDLMKLEKEFYEL